jgi:ornithine cyclodeaminase
MSSPPNLSADEIEILLGRAEAAAAISEAVTGGLEPSQDPKRNALPLRNGQLLLMPSETAKSVGLKAATVAPANPGRGLPRIQATYLLFDADTLVLRAILDGTALTNLRTPAVSLAASEPALARFAGRPVSVVVFGAGPQALGHVEALEECPTVAVGEVAHVVRNVERVRDAVSATAKVLAADNPSVRDVVAAADVIVCATSASDPLFDAGLVRDGSIVIAVGSHEPHVRELDGRLMARAEVLVEDIATALRESGDVIIALAEAHLRVEDLIPMCDVLCGRRSLDPSRVFVFKSSGMSWQDLVVAEAVMERHIARLAARPK